jgi:hypothetical protein
VDFTPAQPLADYSLDTPLVGFSSLATGYAGSHAPHMGGNWKIAVRLPEIEMAELKQIRVNGTVEPLPRGAASIKLRGEGGQEKPLFWEVS